MNPNDALTHLLEAIGPDTTTIVEIPRKDCLDEGNPADANLFLLHDLLSSTHSRTVVQQCCDQLQKDLKRVADSEPPPRLESLAPLHSLTHLVCQLPPQGEWFRQVPLETIPGDTDYLRITCEPWRAVLWPDSRKFLQEVGRPGGLTLAAIISVDTSEHLVTLQFYRLDNTVVASFDVAVPAAGLEQRWWEWIFEEIAAANGSILGSRSSGRLQAKWGKLSVVAVLPGQRVSPSGDVQPPSSDISHAIDCIRGLKGFSASPTPSDRFQRLLDDIKGKDDSGGPLRRTVTQDCLGTAAAQPQLEQAARTDSLLEHVRLWYSRQTPVTPGYESRFGRNPFSFTKPLYLGSYEQLYGVKRPRRVQVRGEQIESRLRLAERLRDHLTDKPTENVVLVGAYRSGKTSVINVVVDLINGASSSAQTAAVADPRPVIAVRVNAAVTPPELLFIAVFNEICKLIESRFAGELPKAIARLVREVAKKLSSSTKNFLALEPSLEVDYALPFIFGLKLKLQDKKERKKSDTASPGGRTTQRRGADDGAELSSTRAGRLRASIAMLRVLLREAARDFDERKDFGKLKPLMSPSQFEALTKASGRLHVVVALDEVTDSAAWGSEWAFPAWRQLIEDPSGEASWLFSSTKPLASATNYSPLGNALREYNLEPLQPSETDSLISNFENVEYLAEPKSQWSMRPTVTYYARRLIGNLSGHHPYVLQVLCCHLFEQSIRHEVPIITTRVVERIVRERVLPELSDYFNSQWRRLADEHAEAIKEAVRESAEIFTLEPWILERSHVAPIHKFGPEVQKELERAGVGSSRHPTVLVPLFAKWVQQHFGLSGKRSETVENRTM